MVQYAGFGSVRLHPLFGLGMDPGPHTAVPRSGRSPCQQIFFSRLPGATAYGPEETVGVVLGRVLLGKLSPRPIYLETGVRGGSAPLLFDRLGEPVPVRRFGELELGMVVGGHGNHPDESA